MIVNSKVAWRRIKPDEIVAMNCATQRLLIWNETASALWERIVGGSLPDELADWLASEYQISRDDAVKDVADFLAELEEQAFISLNGATHALSSANYEIDDPMGTLREIEMYSIKECIPHSVTFETTYVCNEKCTHCFMEKRGAELSTTQFSRILEELAAAGCIFVSFTGGEFFSRRDAFEIIRVAGKLHFAIDVLTNATLPNQEQIQQLWQHPIRRFQVSLYGANANTHDAVTRLPGSFVRTLRAVRWMRETGFKVEISIPLMKQNFAERHDVMRLANDLGCQLLASHLITARNDGSTDTFDFRLSTDQLEDFWRDEALSGTYAGRKPFSDHQLYSIVDSISEAPPCFGGFNTCAITPSGKVLPCNQLHYVLGDLTTESFAEIWNGSPSLAKLRKIKIKALPKCSGCSLLPHCARCPGLATLEGGNLLGRSPENCRNATILARLDAERR